MKMDLNSISKTTFAVICCVITLGLVIELLHTFWVDKPTISTKIEKNLEDTDIPEVVICLDPGFNNATLAKYGYNVNSYSQGAMQSYTKFVGWNGNSSEYDSLKIVEEAMVFPKNETLVQGFYSGDWVNWVNAETTFKKRLYPYGRCLSMTIPPNRPLRHQSNNFLLMNFNDSAFEKLNLSFHKIKIFFFDNVNSPKYIRDAMEMEGNEIEVHLTQEPVAHTYRTRILRSEHVQYDPLYDCAVNTSDNTYDDCIKKDMEKLFVDELGCQPPPFTDDLGHMCNKKFNVSCAKDKVKSKFYYLMNHFEIENWNVKSLVQRTHIKQDILQQHQATGKQCRLLYNLTRWYTSPNQDSALMSKHC